MVEARLARPRRNGLQGGGVIGEDDRKRMREWVERGEKVIPLMEVLPGQEQTALYMKQATSYLTILLDAFEVRERDAQGATRGSVPPVGGGWSPWFFWHHVGRYLRSRGWEYDCPKLGWYEPRHGMDVRHPVAVALAQQLKSDFDRIGSVDDFAIIARRPPWRDEDPRSGGIGARKVRGWLSGERATL